MTPANGMSSMNECIYELRDYGVDNIEYGLQASLAKQHWEYRTHVAFPQRVNIFKEQLSELMYVEQYYCCD